MISETITRPAKCVILIGQPLPLQPLFGGAPVIFSQCSKIANKVFIYLFIYCKEWVLLFVSKTRYCILFLHVVKKKTGSFGGSWIPLDSWSVAASQTATCFHGFSQIQCPATARNIWSFHINVGSQDVGRVPFLPSCFLQDGERASVKAKIVYLIICNWQEYPQHTSVILLLLLFLIEDLSLTLWILSLSFTLHSDKLHSAGGSGIFGPPEVRGEPGLSP